ncbi:acylneuraminate cytidylyltransferase family protein [Flavobacterium phycosphaerae]|uniref:acylneuraminate cytidylyltransferase family protein n=1 Tax=Flavobacterium phycosphaerae TaxID=2697515 RepID=UPI001389846B|nr:acylneuraminate cytidylyltransferase family protein [Flavobacterium phycosphaerae]
MRILGIIPARGGSKGVPRKNIKLLGKMPLIEYTILAAKESKLLTDTIVSTDDEEIAIAAEISGCKPPFIRPSELAQDTSTSIEVVQHAIEFFEKQNIFFDAICLLQPTSPFREEGFIDVAIKKFVASQADSLVSVLPVPHEYNPHWTFEETERGLLTIATGDKIIIPRRQELPKAYHRDGSVYIAKTSVIKKGTFYGASIAYIESNPDFYVNIDTMEDWKQAEALIIKLGL